MKESLAQFELENKSACVQWCIPQFNVCMFVCVWVFICVCKKCGGINVCTHEIVLECGTVCGSHLFVKKIQRASRLITEIINYCI